MSEIVIDECIDSIQIKIARDGLIEVRNLSLEEEINKTDENSDFETFTKIWSDYIRLANVVYLMLDIAIVKSQKMAYFDFQKITRKDAFRTCYKDGKWDNSDVPQQSLAGHYLMGRYEFNYLKQIPMSMDSRLSRRHVITEEPLKLAIEFLKKVILDTEMCDKLNTLSNALSEYKIGNLKNSVVLSWFVIERILNDKYSLYLESRNTSEGEVKRINSKRIDILTGRDFTASIISQILELNNIITLEELKTIDKIRGFRNDVAHHLQKKQITSTNCGDTLQFTAKFLLEGVIEKPELNLSLSFTGF